jgi:large subunit ribosomal protein L7/L12
MEALLEQVKALSCEDKAIFVQKMFEAMPLKDVIAIVPHLEDAWDVEAKPSVPDWAQGGQQEEEEAVQTEFSVIVTALGGGGASRMPAVKFVRAATERSLKESSDLLKSLPATVLEKASKEKADEVKRELESLGATVEVK